MAKLPTIMYDQDHYYRVYFFQWWINREQYKDSLKISGYAPEGWILYTQAEPTPFFFGAYPEESLKKEAETEFSNLTNKDYRQRLLSAYSKMFDMAKRTSKEYFKEFYKKEKGAVLKNPEKVIIFFEELKKTIRFFCSYYLLTQPQRFFKAEEKIKKFDDPELLILIEHGSRSTKLAEFRKILLTITKEIKKSGLEISEFLKKFPKEEKRLMKDVEKFGFLTWDIFGGELTTKKNIREKISKIIKKPLELRTELKNIEKTEEKINKRKSIKINTELHQVAKIIGELLVYRFDTNTYTLCLANYFVQFINAMQEVYQISKIDIQSYKLDELIELLKTGKKIDKEIIQRRKEGYLQIHSHDKFEEYEGSEAREKIKELLKVRKRTHEQSKSLNGTVTSFPDKNKKIIIGKVFVMASNYNADKQLKSFNKGDVLVTTQTHPALVSAMKKAGAIITDEGGLTCHAAIVSRELGIPCIIGTKIATKILKNKDKIEMNMDKGIVKILKRSK